METNKDAQMWAMFSHLAALAGYTAIPFANIIGPLIVWMIKKDEYPFVNEHGKESLNFQISMAIYFVVALVTTCIGIGIVLLIFLGIVNVIFIVIAAIKANSGESYRYPLTLRLVN